MTNTITKSQAYSLLEGLTEKEAHSLTGSFMDGVEMASCATCMKNQTWNTNEEDEPKWINEPCTALHPVTLLDVLERLTNEKGLFDMCSAEELLDYWRPFGFKTPLRNILESAKFEVLPCKEVHSNDRDCTNTEPVLKDEKVEALFQFLINLQLVK